MKRYFTLSAGAAFLAALPAFAQPAAPEKPVFPAPGEIVAAATADEWVAISAADLLVMDLAPLAGRQRRVVIQLIPAPFSQGWVGNIRKLAAAKFWDGTSINRVQDNYVVQWGDATEKKALPDGLAVVPEDQYSTEIEHILVGTGPSVPEPHISLSKIDGIYSKKTGFVSGWPVGTTEIARFPSKSVKYNKKFRSIERVWPTHCYAMVGVGRDLSPNTGSGAELYTVIGHAPRHLDRNIALVGRVIEGIAHLSSLPRGTGALGFYEKEDERVPISSVRLGNEVAGLAPYEYLSTESKSFAAYADARANRRDPFFNVPAGGADICNIPVPVRRKP